jgi:hypothetical protein
LEKRIQFSGVFSVKKRGTDMPSDLERQINSALNGSNSVGKFDNLTRALRNMRSGSSVESSLGGGGLQGNLSRDDRDILDGLSVSEATAPCPRQQFVFS